MAKPLIEIKNLNVTYFLGRPNEIKALKNINLKIYPGEFIVFFGPSGCGKSTLLYTIAGLEREFNGQILFNDKDINKLNNKELATYHQSSIGMIFQAYYLINSLNVLKNVMLPQMTQKNLPRERRENALKLLTKFGVAEQVTKLPNELSGGQQQRVAICRALINNPDILLADEPVGNLDSKSSAEVIGLLKELNEKQKKTIILVTHDPSQLSIAHRIFYMKDGAITETKVNQHVEQVSSKFEDKAAKPSVSKELELLIRTYSNLSSSQLGSMLIPFKAKQIVSEVLVGMTVEEVEKIEKKVESLLMMGVGDTQNTTNFLDAAKEKGGMGMDRRTAENLNAKIKNIISEIKKLEETERALQDAQSPAAIEDRINQIREYLFKTFKLHIEDAHTLEVINQAIQDRLDNKINRATFQKMLDYPLKKGGAGLDRRTARKISKRLELLLLGKYK